MDISLLPYKVAIIMILIIIIVINRGGGELGRQWYFDAVKEKKLNSFNVSMCST